MNAHTPGPWDHYPTGPRMRDMYQQPFCITQRWLPNMIAGIFGDGRGGLDAAKVNAALIAAAPDMLAALRALSPGFGAGLQSGLYKQTMVTDALAAIARAEGRP